MNDLTKYYSIYLMTDSDSHIKRLYISGDGDTGFRHFVHEVVENLDTQIPIPESHLMKFDIPKSTGLDLLKRFTLDERKQEVEKLYRSRQLFPSRVILLAQAVFYRKNGLDISVPLKPEMIGKYEKFQAQ